MNPVHHPVSTVDAADPVYQPVKTGDKAEPVHQPVKTVDKADLEMFDGFLSDGMVSVEEGMAETPVTVLRDTAAGQSVMVEGTIELPETAALGTFVPIEGFGGASSAVPLYRMFVRTNIFVGYADVAVAPELPVKGVTFLCA